MTDRTWTDEDLRAACREAVCKSDVLRALGLSTYGGNFRTVQKYMDRLGLSLEGTGSHTYSEERRGKIPLSEILVQGSDYKSHSLKKRLIEEGILKESCFKCSTGAKWEGEPLSLHLDHINGDSTDHRLENLRILCPNCHSQTPTYAGKRLRLPPKLCRCGAQIQRTSTTCRPCYYKSRNFRPAIHTGEPKLVHECAECAVIIDYRSTRCKSCAAKYRGGKIDWPARDELLRMISETSFSEVGRKLGVSDNAVRKRISRSNDEL